MRTSSRSRRCCGLSASFSAIVPAEQSGHKGQSSNVNARTATADEKWNMPFQRFENVSLDVVITFDVLILIHHEGAIATFGIRTRTPHP